MAKRDYTKRRSAIVNAFVDLSLIQGAGVGFANKIVERKGETYIEDRVENTTGSYFNFAKYNS